MEIFEFTDEHKEHVKILNAEWLEKYFSMEPNDITQLSDPRTEIINKGGHIYYASIDNKIVGTVTLMKVSENILELGKMAVTERYQGMGIGRKLLEHCIDMAKKNKIEKLILYSNTRLISAIELYKKYGFMESELDETYYKRANIKMELVIE